MSYYQDAGVQPQQAVSPMIGDNLYPQNDLIKLALNSSDILDDLKMNLLAIEWDSKTKTWKKKEDMKPLISEFGAQKILTEVASLVNRNTHLSNIELIEINIICRELEHNIRRDFFDNYNNYWENEWEAESNWAIVRSMAGNYAKLALLRAKNGREMSILGGGTRTFINKNEIESSQRITEVPNKKFSGFTGGLFK